MVLNMKEITDFQEMILEDDLWLLLVLSFEHFLKDLYSLQKFPFYPKNSRGLL